MELRSQSYHSLVNMLKDAGVYEEGMQYDELKQLAQAMEMSARQQFEENEEYLQFERARYESELEFLASQNSELHQSTMLPSGLTPPRSSPEPMAVDMEADVSQPDCNSTFDGPIQLSVRAIVHHALDWSPMNERQTVNKRRADPIGSEEKRVRSDNNNNNNQAQEQQPAAADGDVTPASLASMDSGVSWNELSSITSSADESSSVLSIGEMPSGLMVSTSSAAVSDGSRSNTDSSNEIDSYESHE
ncbi:uncharacterized protein LOC111078082 [Drosophila obscura]|uniref:uncharacterized protein LOC111078082 n=1 Tax=Drosophila obscura TaxID=7282 RepID=UPI001BB147B7|nr:uncharacterized protein LOC111078082 [Drosophila obscura]